MPKWTIDPDHSVAGFSVKHLMVANVRGQFNKVAGEIVFDPLKITESSVMASIDAGSLTTGNRKRDDHLLNPDFFDAAKFPKITFKSSKVVSGGGNRLKISGNLTMHGITKPVTFEAEYFGPVKSPYGGEITIGFAAKTDINREDYDINWNVSMEDSGLMVGREVSITLDIEADLAE